MSATMELTHAERLKFWDNVLIGDGCWPWQGRKDTDGYGAISLRSHDRKAHRIAYEDRVGSIPEGLELDHTCHNVDSDCEGGVTCPHRACVSPWHLEPTTSRINRARGRRFDIGGLHRIKTHCANGHPYDEANTRVYAHSDGGFGRACRICGRDAMRRYRERHQED